MARAGLGRVWRRRGERTGGGSVGPAPGDGRGRGARDPRGRGGPLRPVRAAGRARAALDPADPRVDAALGPRRARARRRPAALARSNRRPAGRADARADPRRAGHPRRPTATSAAASGRACSVTRRRTGRVAIVLRVDGSGKVAAVESYAACELSAEALGCMKQVASRLRFNPPASGGETLTIPCALHVARRRPEDRRDRLRRVRGGGLPRRGVGAARAPRVRGGGPPRAHRGLGTFTLSLAGDGRVAHVHVDPFRGEQRLLVCAASALEHLAFAPPVGGRGRSSRGSISTRVKGVVERIARPIVQITLRNGPACSRAGPWHKSGR